MIGKRQNPDFFLADADFLPLAAPRACWEVARIHDDVSFKGHLIIAIDPPIAGLRMYGGLDVSRLLLSAAAAGETLFPIERWPCHVYVFQILDEAIIGEVSFSPSQVYYFTKASLYRSRPPNSPNQYMYFADSSNPKLSLVGETMGFVIIGEQTGEAEDAFKHQVTKLLESQPSVERAYLVRLTYTGSWDENVAIVIVSNDEQAPLRQAVAGIFAAMFNQTEHLDIVFLTPEEAWSISTTCRPFFARVRIEKGVDSRGGKGRTKGTGVPCRKPHVV